jgi:hypothetical protein
MRFIVVDAGDRCVWAQQQKWKSRSMRDSRLELPRISSGAGGKLAFMCTREVSVREDMVTLMLVWW